MPLCGLTKPFFFCPTYNPVFCHSASHLVDANGASAGVWTSMGSSSLAQTTAEGIFNVKTWRAATMSEKGQITVEPHPSPTPNHHMTQGPCLLLESHLYAPPAVHNFRFFFPQKRKQNKKNKQKTGRKNQDKRTG